MESRGKVVATAAPSLTMTANLLPTICHQKTKFQRISFNRHKTQGQRLKACSTMAMTGLLSSHISPTRPTAKKSLTPSPSNSASSANEALNSAKRRRGEPLPLTITRSHRNPTWQSSPRWFQATNYITSKSSPRPNQLLWMPIHSKIWAPQCWAVLQTLHQNWREPATKGRIHRYYDGSRKVNSKKGWTTQSAPQTTTAATWLVAGKHQQLVLTTDWVLLYCRIGQNATKRVRLMISINIAASEIILKN